MKFLYVTRDRENEDYSSCNFFTSDKVTSFCNKLSAFGQVNVRNWDICDGEFINAHDAVFYVPVAVEFNQASFIRNHSKLFFIDLLDPSLRFCLRENDTLVNLGKLSDGIICHRYSELPLLKHLFGADKIILYPDRIKEYKNLGLTSNRQGKNLLIYIGIGGDMNNSFPIAQLMDAAINLNYLGYAVHLIADETRRRWLMRLCGFTVYRMTSQIEFFKILAEMQGVVIPFILDSSLSTIVQCACFRTPVWSIPHTGFGELLFPELIYHSLEDIQTDRDDLPQILQDAYDKADIFSYENFFKRLKQWDLELQ